MSRRFLLSGGLQKGTCKYRKLISRTFLRRVGGEGKAPNSRRLIWGRNRYESEKPRMTSVCVEMSFHENFGLGNPINPDGTLTNFRPEASTPIQDKNGQNWAEMNIISLKSNSSHNFIFRGMSSRFLLSGGLRKGHVQISEIDIANLPRG
ncbi:hypothetical protein CEXT_440201 [Caerostris extrusa]|uniref:Ribosomal protein L2 n=1 Tax=Caerostris extrusa TaxID=172846 RepID=A0AAV4XDU1_CAEEX|nr:hypothetical protein CEXT_440201 [Caerostris extrusa]